MEDVTVLANARPTIDNYANLLRRQKPLAILMALRQIEVVEAAVLLYTAERAGACRPEIIRAAECRIEELEGGEPEHIPTLHMGGVAVDPDMKKWENEHDKKSH